MNPIHLKLRYSYDIPTLCGLKYSVEFNYWHIISTYLRYPDLYDKNTDFDWCPDCANHPDIIMARLNETNV